MNENYKAEIEKLYELMSQRKNDYDTLTREVKYYNDLHVFIMSSMRK